VDAQTIINLVNGVTAPWCKQRKAEERQASRALRRRETLIRHTRVTVKSAAYAVMEQAYLKASSNGEYPAHARQIMYAARPLIQEQTDRPLNDQYFCQTLLPDYLNDHPQKTAHWDVAFDARGHFEEPHTRLIVPLGTLDVRDYLHGIPPGADGPQTGAHEVEITGGVRFPTRGPRNRFAAVLFIEKEGFLPLFKKAKLAERYDIAIMSTKGMSVTASRLLVDRLCGGHNVPLLVLRDFDKSGFSIAGTLQRDTHRYSFTRAVRVIDLGLRLKDVEEQGLEAEGVAYGSSDPKPNLRENGATREEIDFLCEPGRGPYTGQRVELNAFPSGDLVTWIEAGLKRHGVRKVVPDDKTLETAFRRAATRFLAERQIEEVARKAQEQARQIGIPGSLTRQVRKQLAKKPEAAWDVVVAALARLAVKRAHP
jgi:hypothetical protein